VTVLNGPPDGGRPAITPRPPPGFQTSHQKGISIMTFTRFLIGLVVVGLLCFVISEPHTAGATGASAVHTVFGWGKGLATACVTFVRDVV
jgi:hypothetical protein